MYALHAEFFTALLQFFYSHLQTNPSISNKRNQLLIQHTPVIAVPRLH